MLKQINNQESNSFVVFHYETINQLIYVIGKLPITFEHKKKHFENHKHYVIHNKFEIDKRNMAIKYISETLKGK